jgi:hypothetical protein
MTKSYLLTFFLVLSTSVFSFGQDLKKEYQEIISRFINCVNTNNKEQVVGMVSFPFDRHYPIPSINNKQEFLKRYNEVFDDSLKKMIIKSNPAKDWSDMGWRGIMLYDGVIWIDFNGRLMTINYQSAFEKENTHKIILEEKSKLYSSLRQFNQPLVLLETQKFRIRIDDLDSSRIRYACWPLEKDMSEKPDLILDNGHLEFHGSGGNHSYSFKNGDYSYICYVFNLRNDKTPPARLMIYFKNKEILSQDAKIIK